MKQAYLIPFSLRLPLPPLPCLLLLSAWPPRRSLRLPFSPLLLPAALFHMIFASHCCGQLLILDEPTNFLDRDSLGALTRAIQLFAGGVIVISHQREFYSTVCTERWIMEGGECTVQGSDWWEGFSKARKKEAERAAKEAAKGESKTGGISKMELKKIKKKVR